MKWSDIQENSHLLAGLLVLSLLLTDCFGGRQERVPGIVEGRQYTPPYTSLSCSTSNGRNSCHTVYHAASYCLYVRSAGGLAQVSTTGAGYAVARNGEVLTYTCLRTRWTHYTWGNSYSPQ
ncbi:hypothetical protein CDA63_11780 [Hymenobacter amundsenii]|uniref:Uncharacterized protein n=1 Tax=Hymenobacter amundsenii TaxID=2006685 RepID=A0A246FK24_9BACT|nr:hypothetical protein [Hymenobacter amundsenii]OWP62891.1 hypothetical protein CDA63_11780 [Hymenobacter amundsenii]